jgi:hypothetical protein
VIEIKDASQLEFAKRFRDKLLDDFNEHSNISRSHTDYAYRRAQRDALAFLYDELSAAITGFERGLELKRTERLWDYLTREGGAE